MEGLKPANENPWYVLMTLHGEQEGEEIDWELHERNRATWNAWAYLHDPDATKEARNQGFEFQDEELIKTLWAVEFLEWLREYTRRNPYLEPITVGWEASQTAIALDSLDFGAPLCIRGFFIPKKLRANDSVFRAFVDMSECHAADLMVFMEATFHGPVTAKKSYVANNLGLSFSTVQQGITFHSVNCGSLSLDDLKLAGSIHLGFLESKRGLSMSGIKPIDRDPTQLRATNMKIGGMAVITGSTFSDSLHMGSSKFDGPFISANLKVGGDVDFGGAIFSGSANFASARFSKAARFHQTTFKGRAHFEDATFSAEAEEIVTFKDAAFEAPVSFRCAIFKNAYPDLEGSILHQTSIFTPDTLNSRFWPSAKAKLGEEHAKQAKASCAVIRHALGKQGLPEAEHFFFRREMGFAARIGSPWERLPYLLFGWLSDYGYSIRRPLAWLGGLWSYARKLVTLDQAAA